MHGQQVCRRLEVQPGSLLRIRFSWLLCVRSRQALLVVEPLLLLFLRLEEVPMKSVFWTRCRPRAQELGRDA